MGHPQAINEVSFTLICHPFLSAARTELADLYRGNKLLFKNNYFQCIISFKKILKNVYKGLGFSESFAKEKKPKPNQTDEVTWS